MQMTNSIDSSYYLSTYQAEKKQQDSSSKNILGKDDFLKILIAQLQNQDPTNPMEDRDFIAQMAQFSSLEQMVNMNKTLEGFIDAQKHSTIIGYNQFLGKEVTYRKESDSGVETSTGKVVSVQYGNNKATLILEDGTKVDPDSITKINDSSLSNDENSLVQASMLIGKQITYLTSNSEENSAVVTSVSLKNGKIYYQLDDGSKNVTSSQIIKIAQRE